jgi:hypothetical protein
MLQLIESKGPLPKLIFPGRYQATATAEILVERPLSPNSGARLTFPDQGEYWTPLELKELGQFLIELSEHGFSG